MKSTTFYVTYIFNLSHMTYKIKNNFKNMEVEIVQTPDEIYDLAQALRYYKHSYGYAISRNFERDMQEASKILSTLSRFFCPIRKTRNHEAIG